MTYISSQGHGYAVDASVLEEKNIAKVSYTNVNDGTNEGLEYIGKKIFTVQFQPAAEEGVQYTSSLYNKFVEMMGGNK